MPSTDTQLLHVYNRISSERVREWIIGATEADLAAAIEIGAPAAMALAESREKTKTALEAAARIVQECSQLHPGVSTREQKAHTNPLSVITREFSSAVLGSQGEANVSEILRREFGQESIVDMTKTARAGDFTLTHAGISILVEVKNYSSVVPVSQVSKFHRDIIASSLTGGIMVSVGHHGITKTPRGFSVSYPAGESRRLICGYVDSCEPSVILGGARIILEKVAMEEMLSRGARMEPQPSLNISEISSCVQAISRARSEIQQNLGDISGRLVSVTNGLVCAEAKLRDAWGDLKEQQASADVPPILVNAEQLFDVSNSTGYTVSLSRYTNEILGNMKATINIVEKSVASHHRGISSSAKNKIPSWKVSARQATHVLTGIIIKFLGSPVTLIPRDRLTPEQVASGYSQLGDLFQVDTHVQIQMSSRSNAWLEEVLNARDVPSFISKAGLPEAPARVQNIPEAIGFLPAPGQKITIHVPVTRRGKFT